MPDFKLKIKTGEGAPASGALETAELGYNSADKKLYIGNDGALPSGVSMDGHLHDISDVNSLQTELDFFPKYIASRGQNLITNGTGLLGDNTNFS
jgi:hypothetical protein